MTDNREMRHEVGSAVSSQDRPAGEDLSFAAFVLAHLECPEETIEIRLGEGLLLEWCPACPAIETFDARGRGVREEPAGGVVERGRGTLRVRNGGA